MRIFVPEYTVLASEQSETPHDTARQCECLHVQFHLPLPLLFAESFKYY